MALTRITKGVIKPNENYDTHNINSTGIVTAVGANFTGNVSVGGTLTYEDVTSIDSVGIITAKQGIHVTNGNVGIGTNNPTEKLDIISATNSQTLRIWSKGSSSSSSLMLRTGDSGGAFIKFGDNSDNDIGQIHYSNSQEAMRFVVNTQERLRITSAGLVGIGSDAPTLGLDINKGANSGVFLGNPTHGYKLRANVSGSHDYGILIEDEDGVDLYRAVSSTGTSNADTHTFYTAGSERLRIDSNGRIGLGIANPDAYFASYNRVVMGRTNDSGSLTIESPQLDLIYRGKVDLVDGTATVNIDSVSGMSDGTFVLLNRDVQCFTTNETGWTNVKGTVSGNVLTIIAQDNNCTDTISWMVIGERQDDNAKSSNTTDDSGNLIVEPPTDENVDTSHLHQFYPE